MAYKPFHVIHIITVFRSAAGPWMELIFVEGINHSRLGPPEHRFRNYFRPSLDSSPTVTEVFAHARAG